MNLSAENISKIRELVRSGYPLKACDAQDLLGHNDHLTALLEARFRLMLSVEGERDQLQAAIATSESVFINLKAGKIPKPSLRSMIDLYGEVLNGEDAQLLEIAKLRAENEALRKDAERYRWLRGQHWNESEMAVVCYPQKAVKLGFDCPSEGRLDSAIDAAIGKGEQS